MIRCPRCGNELPDGVAFCDACGAPISGGGLPPASPVYQPYGAAPAAGGVPTMASPATTVCPVCGAPVIPGEAFCDNCGSSLLGNAGPAPAAPYNPPAAPYNPPAPYDPPASPPAPYNPPPLPTPPAYAPPVATPLGARLVVSSTRAEIPLPARSEIVIGREDPLSNSYPDLDLNPHGALELGVSRRHAQITGGNGQYYLEDLNSVNGTLINQRRIAPRTRMPLHSGDQVMFGRLGLIFEQV